MNENDELVRFLNDISLFHGLCRENELVRAQRQKNGSVPFATDVTTPDVDDSRSLRTWGNLVQIPQNVGAIESVSAHVPSTEPRLIRRGNRHRHCRQNNGLGAI